MAIFDLILKRVADAFVSYTVKCAIGFVFLIVSVCTSVLHAMHTSAFTILNIQFVTKRFELILSIWIIHEEIFCEKS